jgi:hypothetical protein
MNKVGQRGPFRHLQGVAGPAVLAGATFLVMWSFGRLDFDRHHDGYMLAQAIAVHQGGSIQADVFAQYGPVLPWLQSAALYLPLGPALALRALNAVFVSVTVFLLADMGRSTPRDWPVSPAVGWWAAVVWVVLADFWLATPMLPWSSTLSALLSVATLYFLTRALRHAEDGEVRAASLSGLAGGLFLGVIPFTRINVGVSAVAVCFVVAGLIYVGERSSRGAVAKLFVLGTFLSSVAVVLVLFLTSSLADFYAQSVLWPITWGQKATGTIHTQVHIGFTFAVYGLPVALVCGALLLQYRARTVQRGWSVTRSGANIVTLLVGLVTLMWVNFAILGSLRGVSWRSVPSELFSYLRSGNRNFMFFLLTLLVTVAISTCIIAVFKYIFDEGSSRKPTPWLLLGGLALSGLTQTIPTWDQRHGWWGAPIGLLLLFAVVGKTSLLNRPTGNPLMLLLLGQLAMAIFSGPAFLGSARVQGPPGTVIEGMRVSRTALRQITEDTKFLGQELRGTQPVVYLVNDGDLSILDGKYRSADPYFVDWGEAPQLQTRIVDGNSLVVQRSHFSDGKISELARSIKYRIAAKNERLVVLRPINSPAQ